MSAMVHPFLQQANVSMLWEVIADEEAFRFLSMDAQQSVYQLFHANLKGFCDKERTRASSLVDLNKKYVLLILSHVKKQLGAMPSKLVIHPELPPKEAITIEDIQSARRSQFDMDVSRHKQNFDSFNAVQPPPTPSFADAHTDTPIQEIDKILKNMQAQRNYEVNTFAPSPSSATSAESWLTPQETSLKPPAKRDKIPDPPASRFKFLNTLQDPLDTEEGSKAVNFSKITEVNTFVPELDEGNEPDEEDQSVFAKLKKVAPLPPPSHEERLTSLERKVESLHQKMDALLARR